MFIGHFGAAMGAKKIDSRISLGTLILASQFIDLLWPVLILLGIEKVKIEPGNTPVSPLNFVSYPYSHSLLAVVVWGALFALVYFLLKKEIKGALLLGALVISHWVLDFISHAPDLLIMPGLNLKVGLGLWYSLPLTIIVEGGIFAAGIYFFVKASGKRDSKFGIRFWSLVIFLSIIYLSNLFGPPPPSVEDMAYATLALWIFVLWGYWIDRVKN